MKKMIRIYTTAFSVLLCGMVLTGCSGERRKDSLMEDEKPKFRLEEVFIDLPALEGKEYKIAWISDLHIVTDVTESEDVTADSLETIEGRYHSFVTPDGKYHSAELWEYMVDYLNALELDGIVLGGDILDYYSASNVDTFMKEYERLNKDIPIMYLRADHDYGFWYGIGKITEEETHRLHTQIDGDAIEDKYLEFEDFVIAGINYSNKNIPEDQYDQLVTLHDMGKPVIVATHVPFASNVEEMGRDGDGNEMSMQEFSMQVKGKPYYWGSENYVPYEYTASYMNEYLYSEQTNTIKVLAGHVHGTWEGKISNQVSQHVFAPAYEGVIGLIHIK